MKVLIRGVPNFIYTQIVEVKDFEQFVASHELRISNLVLEKQTYHRADGKRVMLYIEGTEENKTLLSRCRWEYRSQAYLYLRLLEDGRVSATGTMSTLCLDQGYWYNLEPVRDPRYPELKARKKIEWGQERRRREEEEAREEAMRERVMDAAEALGLEEALRRLT